MAVLHGFLDHAPELAPGVGPRKDEINMLKIHGFVMPDDGHHVFVSAFGFVLLSVRWG